MLIERIIVGDFGVNCYIVAPEKDSKNVYVIDPGDDGEVIVNYLRENNLSVIAVLHTHAHLDHIKGSFAVANAFAVKVYVGDADLDLFSDPRNEIPPHIYRDVTFPVPEAISSFKTTDFDVIATPGHTQGGICFYFSQNKELYSGDTLFCQSVGRSDLPGGNHAQLIENITKKLMILPKETKVFPGHGNFSSIGEEKMYNPFL